MNGWLTEARYGCSSCLRVFSTGEALLAHHVLTDEYVADWNRQPRPVRKGDRRCTNDEELRASGLRLCRDDVWRPEGDSASVIGAAWDRATRNDRAAQARARAEAQGAA